MEHMLRTGRMDRSARVSLVAAACLGTSALVFGQSTTRVSTSPVNTQGNYHNFLGAASADGRYVAFQSLSSNLTLTDTNFHLPDILVKDRTTGNTTMASVSSGGMQGDSGSMAPSISADGRYVAFESLASNLVAGDTNGAWDVFVRDQVAGSTVRVSVGPAGLESNGASRHASISADGRYVAFESEATNLAAGDTNAVADVFVHDLQTGTTVRASVDSSGSQGDAASSWPALSGDGRIVAFDSIASNLVTGDTNGVADVFVRDLQSGLTTRVSVDSAGAQGDLYSDDPSISADGRVVVFESDATNLVAGDGNGVTDVFAHDRSSGVTTRVSVSSLGVEGNSISLAQGTHMVSSDGRFVAFDSVASNLVTGDTNGGSDCFVRDVLAGTTVRVSVTTTGTQAGGGSRSPWITPDGRFVVFESSASNLVTGDTNLMYDVFLRDRGAEPAVPFCFGDGTGLACPCANSGAPGRGCANSIDASGARLAATGTARVSADTFVLLGSGMPNSTALYFQGTSQLNGGTGAMFGDGLRCAGGTVIRLGTRLNAGGASRYPDAGDVAISVRGLVAGGDARTYQIWYRNAAAFCTTSTFNLSNGLGVTWIP
jgi:Tol biopolymer transport system component